MNINQKINAKGNEDVFYASARGRYKNVLISKNYKQPFQDINLPDRLYLRSQYGVANNNGH